MSKSRNLENTALLPETQKKMVQLMGSFGEGVHTQHELVEAFHKFVTTTEHVVNEKQEPTVTPKLSASMKPTIAKPVKTKPKRQFTRGNNKMPIRNGKIVAI